MIKDLTIKKLVYKGFGLGFHNSKPVFIPHTAQGENLDVKIVNETKNVIFAKIDKINRKSSHRKKAACEVFQKCGGCNWLHLDYQQQLAAKAEIVKEIFHNVEDNLFEQIQASPKAEFYRNKTFYPIAEQDNQVVFGIYKNYSHTVIQHKKCFLQPNIYDDIAKIVMSYIQKSNAKIYQEKNDSGNIRHLGFRYAEKTNELLVILVTKKRKLPFSKQLVRMLTENFANIIGIVQNINSRKTNVILGSEEKILFGRDHLFEMINDLKFKYRYNSFLQINTQLAEKLYSYIGANISANSKVLDAYCGVGTISISVATKADSVIGIESNDAAVEDAIYNAEINGVTNCTFICGKVENKLTNNFDIDTVIFDPPRKGLEKSIIKNIPVTVKKIIYISCDPTTQFRDIKRLLKLGFKIEKVKPFDMFPQTYHIENVAVLIRNEN